MKKIFFFFVLFGLAFGDVVNHAPSYSTRAHSSGSYEIRSGDVCNSEMAKKLIDNEMQKLKGFVEVGLIGLISQERRSADKKAQQIILNLLRELNYSFEAKEIKRFDDSVSCEITSFKFKSGDNTEISIGVGLLQELKKINPNDFEGAVFHILDLNKNPRLYNPLLEELGQEMLR